MKKIEIILILLTSITIQQIVHGQSVEVTSGINLNNFYHRKLNEPRYGANYENQMGIHLGINLKLNKKEIEEALSRIFYLSYDNYQGSLLLENGGRGSFNSTKINFNNHIIGLSFFPLDWNIIKDKVFIIVGPEFSYLISSKIEGSYFYSDIGGNTESQRFDQNDKSIQTNFKIGLTGRMKYEIRISEKYSITPQYSFRLGLNKEFNEYAQIVRGTMHRFMIGVTYN